MRRYRIAAGGRWLFRSDLRTRYGETLMLRRPILLDILRSALPAEAITLNTTVTDVERSGDQLTIAYDGVRRPVELLVGADGLRSTVRSTALDGTEILRHDIYRLPHCAATSTAERS